MLSRNWRFASVLTRKFIGSMAILAAIPFLTLKSQSTKAFAVETGETRAAIESSPAWLAQYKALSDASKAKDLSSYTAHLCNLADIYASGKVYNSADALYKQAIDLCRSGSIPDHADLLESIQDHYIQALTQEKDSMSQEIKRLQKTQLQLPAAPLPASPQPRLRPVHPATKSWK